MSYVTQSLHRLVQRAPDAVGSIDGSNRRSWREVERDVRLFAGALRRSGVLPGDRVALLASNSARHLDYILGCFWTGAVINPVNTRWSPAEMAYSLQDCETRVLIVAAEFAHMASQIMAQVPGLREIVIEGDGAVPGTTPLGQWLDSAEEVEDTRTGGNSLAAILYTGGTTGRPKGVMLSHANLLASATGYYGFPGARPGASYLHVAPLFHIGCLSGMFTSLLAGSTQVFLPAFQPASVIETIEREAVTDVFLVPTMLRSVMLDPAFAPDRLSSLERIVYGASAIDDALLDRAMAALPNVGFVQAYGMTEVGPIATMLGPADHGFEARSTGRVRSAGRATIAAEVQIVDSQDRELPRGEAGEIVVRGGGVMLGYWNLPDETASALRGGWMHTGDIGRMDDEGFVTVVDRLKDMIVSGGENIYSAEVENVLSLHPDVQQAAVIGLPHPQWGEAVHAAIILRPGAKGDVEGLRGFCRERIAAYKVPKTVAFVDGLPLSPAGKVLKMHLRAAFEKADEVE